MYILYILCCAIYLHFLRKTYFLEKQWTVIVNHRVTETPVKNVSKIWAQNSYFPYLPLCKTYREFCCKNLIIIHQKHSKFFVCLFSTLLTNLSCFYKAFFVQVSLWISRIDNKQHKWHLLQFRWRDFPQHSLC